MIISINWLKDIIDYNLSSKELEDGLTSLGLECTYKKNDISYSDIVVGKILSVSKVENSDHLNLCSVELGDEKKDIVCGANNVQAGILVPIALPGLLRGRRIQEKAASVGFDWDNNNQVIAKVDEEINELKEAIVSNKGIEEEFGDVLFSIINLSRHLNINPEKSLSLAINKFTVRFKNIEKDLNNQKINIKDLPLEQLDKLWEENKKKEIK